MYYIESFPCSFYHLALYFVHPYLCRRARTFLLFYNSIVVFYMQRKIAFCEQFFVLRANLFYNYHWMPSMKNTLNARYANNVPWVTSLCNLRPSIFISISKMIRHSIMYSASFSLSSFFLSLSKMRKCCHQRCTLDACITNTSLFGVLLHCSHQLRNILYINVFVVKSSPFSTCNLHVFVTFNSP